MINLTKPGMILATVGMASIVAAVIPTTVSAQNMTGNMTGGQNMTADVNQTGSISGRGGVTVIDIYDPPYSIM